MRSLSAVLALAVIAVGGLWAGQTYAPCSPPIVALSKYGLKTDAVCPRRGRRRGRSAA